MVLKGHLMALTHHSDCRTSAEKAVGAIRSWPMGSKRSPTALMAGDRTAHTEQTRVTEARQTVRRPLIWLVCRGLEHACHPQTASVPSTPLLSPCLVHGPSSPEADRPAWCGEVCAFLRLRYKRPATRNRKRSIVAGESFLGKETDLTVYVSHERDESL